MEVFVAPMGIVSKRAVSSNDNRGVIGSLLDPDRASVIEQAFVFRNRCRSNHHPCLASFADGLPEGVETKGEGYQNNGEYNPGNNHGPLVHIEMVLLN